VNVLSGALPFALLPNEYVVASLMLRDAGDDDVPVKARVELCA
jgi:hypothetical protein